MIVKPKTKGFICTTAHPVGCEKNVEQAVAYAKAHPIPQGPKRVLVLGSSTGYGLASRIAATFGSGADSVGVFFERPAAGKRTASAGWYNNLAFERLARQEGRVAESINGDAYSNEIKEQAIRYIQDKLPGGQVDLVIYSLAAPKRTDPNTGEVYSSVIKPIGAPFLGKTVDFHSGEVTEVEVPPATEKEIADTVKVMGGEDWLLWIEALQSAGVLAPGALTLAYSYLGPVLTHAVYKDGTIGRAKEDLEAKANEIDALLSPTGGKAFVSVNKALVTQASAAIPVVPLYISLLFREMKERGTHEDCTMQMVRMMERIYQSGSLGHWNGVPTDEEGRIRMDDWEMDAAIQAAVAERWDEVSTANLESLADLAGYRDDFFHLFGFNCDSVDYEEDVEIDLN
ncbi:MAG: enoyl-ACP reductase FabV [Oscillospiraceae bacterium]